MRNIFNTCLIAFAITLTFVAPALANALKGHASSYLALHGEDPVNWQEWTAAALAQAKKENKLLFVSIGYFSCHWCHVMQRESFSDQKVAEMLNANFISVKVDRELNPALDAYLLDFVTRTRGTAGWPLNVFLTPDGHPLVGVVYLPTDRLLTLLDGLQRQWQEMPEYLAQTAANAVAAIKGEAVKSDSPVGPDLAKKYESILVQQALRLADEMDGGFGEQTKFPMVPQLDSLLSAYQRNPLPQVKSVLTLTLDRMASQGLRDHLGGGFFRYATDPGWQTPHFEKMLYDNVLLAGLYLRAATILKRADYEETARNTLDFMLEKMRAKDGAMISSFSAIDDAGVEGGYYLWQSKTLQGLLTQTEFQLVKTVWGTQGHAPFEAGHLFRVQMSAADAAKRLNISAEKARHDFDSAKQKLLAARAQRVLPVDEKKLAAWNGLALSAFVQAARLPGGEKYRDAAKGVRDYLVNVLWDGQRLLRARSANGELGQAGLEDYAFAAQGLLAWAELTKKDSDFQLVTRWVKDAWRRFHDQTGWVLSDQTLLPSGFGVAMMDEGPLPSPSAVLLELSNKVARRNGDKALAAQVAMALRAGHTQLREVAFDYPTQVRLLVSYYFDEGSNHD